MTSKASKRLSLSGLFRKGSTNEGKKSRNPSAGSPLSKEAISPAETNGHTPTEANGNAVAPSAVAAAVPKPDLVTLATTIAQETEKLNAYLKEQGIQLSFDVNAPQSFPKLPEELQKSRHTVISATKELGDLVAGATERLRWMAWDHNDSLSLHAIYHYQIVNETATYAQIAAKIGLDETNTRRFLRHAMTNRIFVEPTPNVVAHTVASRVLAEDPKMDAWVGVCMDELWPSSFQTIAALKLNPAADEPTQAGFTIAHNTLDKAPLFAVMGADPTRAKRFGMSMASLTGGEGYELSYLLDSYSFADVNAIGGTFVDLGGSHGFVCVELAKKYPAMKFVVQDLQKTVDSAPQLPQELASRITFQAHDFHTAQPVKGADVYFFRWILHNQSEKYAINMLRQLTPALKKGSKVVINDHCLRKPGEETEYDEKIMRSMDLTMLSLLNAQERDEDEFQELFAKVDKRWKFEGVVRAPRYRMGVVSAVWAGDDEGAE